MVANKNSFIILVLLFFLINVCKKNKAGESTPEINKENFDQNLEKHLPSNLRDLENLEIYSLNNQFYDTVEIIGQRVFKNNNKIFIDGYIGNIAIDNRNRVYIKAEKPGAAGIYIFEGNGDFVTSINNYGRGPGEVMAISSMVIGGNQLYMYDPKQHKISIYSIDDYKHSYDLVIKKDSVKNDIELAPLQPTGNFFVLDDGQFLMGFELNSIINPNKHREILYYRVSQRGQVLPGKVLSSIRFFYFTSDNKKDSEGYLRLPQSMPFTNSTFISVSGKNIYTANSKYFLIKKYDLGGKYQRAIFYSYDNSKLLISDLELGETEKKLIKENSGKVPETWPALHNMVIDDEERLWVFTITDSDSSYKGWVLNKKGELLAKFDWPGSRNERSPGISPLFKVKNGYLYTRERDIEQGIDQIIKYKINFKKR